MGAEINKNLPAELILFEGQETPHQYLIFRKVDVGRGEQEIVSPHKIDLPLPFLDEKQCVIERRGDQWYYKNLSEETFTFVAGKPLLQGQERELSDGDIIRVANGRMVTGIFLKDRMENTRWESINMDSGSHTVRITDTSDLSKSEAERDFVTLQYADGRWQMTELHSDHVSVNGTPVTIPGPIKIDDKIKIDETLFVFESARMLYGYPISNSDGLSVQIDERTARHHMKTITLLKDINLQIAPGNMVLILGGSGAGKTTFINAITGYEKAKATITEGGYDYYRQYNDVKYRIGMVPQQDLMRGEDTVYATLKNAAEMRLPNSTTEEEMEQRISNVLNTFALWKLKDEQVSKLSGGQRKRLSICVEYISLPMLFILDEPDSGLDGIMARELMENLKLIAWEGRIVMVVTHTPDRVIDLFDQVIVLAKGSDSTGQMAFYGSPAQARQFFDVPTMEGVVKRINTPAEGGDGLADFYIDKYRALCEEKEKNNIAASGASDQASKERKRAEKREDKQRKKDAAEVTGGTIRHTGRLGQMRIYLGKLFRLFILEKNWVVLPTAGIIAVLVMLVMGDEAFVNMEGTAKASLILMCLSIWNGFFNSVQSVCKERPILKREHRAGLHMSSYIAAHMIYQFVICVLQTAICMLIYYVFGLKLSGAGLMTPWFAMDLFITLFLMTYAADMMSLLLSCLVHTTTTAMTLMPFLLIFQLVFSGGFLEIQGGFSGLSNLTISKWGMNAVCSVSNYNDQPSTALTLGLMRLEKSPELAPVIEYAKEKTDLIPKMEAYVSKYSQDPQYAYTKKNVGKDWAILAAFALIYALLGMIALEFIDKDKR